MNYAIYCILFPIILLLHVSVQSSIYTSHPAHEEIGLKLELLLFPQIGISVSFLEEINKFLRNHIHILYFRKFNKKGLYLIIRCRKYLTANLLKFTFRICSTNQIMNPVLWKLNL